MQHVAAKPEDLSLAIMVGRLHIPGKDRGFGVAGDGQFTILMMMYIIAFFLIRFSEAVTGSAGRS
ncbi:hypothetical protein PJI16_04405 [Nitrospira sp. MA-1]|nr:hypothetical protein [Nitrospira sp. MA-1]